MGETADIYRALVEGPRGPTWTALGLPRWDARAECWRDGRGRFAASPLSRIERRDRPVGVPYYNPQAFRTITGL